MKRFSVILTLVCGVSMGCSMTPQYAVQQLDASTFSVTSPFTSMPTELERFTENANLVANNYCLTQQSAMSVTDTVTQTTTSSSGSHASCGASACPSGMSSYELARVRVEFSCSESA
ncbi:hypothetical protein [Umboniibacter marinipuniceus]|uniref:Lipoprotein n=1 Tax=Umboniibacter marinipuniceus TaxID=569599 RepID=A0A3M0A8I5_9GAMM|nr:hypothetical protein [Umboniibacter marinipuniceus]RMA78725.1 hypothetical protein DFR27_2063 [Umboniibacter marinipuniceus]